MFSDEDAWPTVYTEHTNQPNTYSVKAGTFVLTLTPEVAGVYTYRVTYDGGSQYAPTVSNNVTLTVPFLYHQLSLPVTLTVTNVAMS